ncbi:hypothetical protein AVEN_179539-1 [Araneus ventricosus]|uniref:Uncharacterized protein n=1 Tax=Araneus ventricosus TaxID=182803 RepID=A0A4Y2TT90_ARAVE|nr:hypothetical protein AVEN_189572-1 [Araneus ventricosus]GBO02384.1 hypothetical protein AVEN_179539-1 [Araneus ventricosus]
MVVRLRGFHLLMPFMGIIGTIMAGSGLKELLTIIYAENSVKKIMNGPAYSRAVRAHVSVPLVLAKLIWESVDLSEVMLENTLNNMDTSVVLNIEENELLRVVSTKFRQALHTLESRGPTTKLWVQYFSMVTLIKQFIEADKMGNWTLHLTTAQKILPFFHAVGHFYAKCAHLYFQDM